MPDLSALNQQEVDLYFMQQALVQAKNAEKTGEVPVGAVLVYKNSIISSAYNTKEQVTCAVNHAEILAIQHASKALGRWRLSGCTLYVTLEPCLMCAGAIIASRIDRVVYAAIDPKAGAVQSVFNLANHPKLNHEFKYTQGVLENECSQTLKDFFKKKRSQNKSKT